MVVPHLVTPGSSTFAIGLIGALIVIGVILHQLSDKKNFPAIIPLLLLGIFVGPIMGWFDVTALEGIITPLITFALIVVLFDSGYGMRWSRLKSEILPSTVLTMFAVIITLALVFVFGKYVLDLSWQLALMLGALVASTDITIVHPLINQSKKITENLKETLSLEAALNSVFAAVIAILLYSSLEFGTATAQEAVHAFLYTIFVGLGIGLILGYLILKIVLELKADHQPHIISIGAVVLVYAITEAVGASGILSALVVGIVFGNAEKYGLPRIIKSFGGEMEMIITTFIYFILGALFSFTIFKSHPIFVILFIAIIFIARFAAVQIFAFNKPKYEQWVMFFSGPRGIVTAVLALSYLSLFPEPNLILGLVFATIIVSAFATLPLPFLEKIIHIPKR